MTGPMGDRVGAAVLDAARGAVRGHALFVHCLGDSSDSSDRGDSSDSSDRAGDRHDRGTGAADEIARTLAGRGIGVLRTGFSGDVEDLVRAADRMRADGRAPDLLVGHCLGGAAVLAAAARIPEVRAVATIGASVGPGAPTAAPGVPVLVLHAPDDEVVGFDQAGRVAAAAGPASSVVALAGADHHLGRPEDARWAAGLIESWASRFLPVASDPAAAGVAAGVAGGDRPEPGTVVVSASGARPYGQDVDTDLLHWSADEPVSAGGAGSGPDPYQLLLSSLGACTAITLRMYADRAGLPLDDATVTLTHDRLHARDCAECETSTGRVDRIVREIHLAGDLDDAQRARLLAIADRCPVHRTLTSEMVIETDEV